MYSTRKILLCFLLYNIDGLFFSKENLVFDIAAFENPSTPGLAIRTAIKTAIKVSSHLLGSWRPLTLFTPLDETSLVNLTSQSLDMRILTSKTVATVTGGVFGPDNYQFHKYSCYWNTGSCNVTSMECRVYFFNLKYDAYKKALDYDDGIMIMNSPVATDGDFPNPLFYGLSELLGKKLKRPGDFSKVHSAFTYRWYVNFPPHSIYESYRADFYDEEFGKKFCAVVINLPVNQHLNYISREQFKQTFGNLIGISQKAVTNGFLQNAGVAKTPVERHEGIYVCNIPA